jgi:hypothetical protein
MFRWFLAIVTGAVVVTARGPVDLDAQAPPQAVGEATPRAKPLPSIADRTNGFRRLDGFYPLYWDDAAGILYLEIPQLDQDVLYVEGLSAGLGSNDIGLDRAQLGAERLVRFQRVGQKILMVQPNLDYRAVSNDPDERRAVEDAFAKSVIWGFTAIAETGGRVLVDLSDFIMRDTHRVAASLRPASYRFDRSRSAVYMERTRAFPQNTEIDVTSTFVSDDAGRGAGPGQIGGRIADVTPSPEAVTVRQHHSFVQLPDANYTPRMFDPRSGFDNFDYVDYATPLGEPMRKQFIVKHRLEKRDPGAAMSDPVKPIIYYVDRGTPEPIRSALVEGARWWNQAFEAAGYRNAFQVEVMTEGADPMDVRDNTITWVHRSTRGWSYGGSIIDPRTGEIIKGHVSLGSLRVRQDYLILEGLLGGQDYIYAMRGDGRAPVRWAPADAQRKALDALMSALKLNELALPSGLLAKIPPRPPGFGRTRELFPRFTGGAFDPISPAVVATDMVVSGLLTTDRAARMVAQHAVEPSLPGFDDVLNRLVVAVFDAVPATPYEAEINRAMERVVISRVMSLAQSAPMTQVRAIATQTLRRLQTRYAAPAPGQAAAEQAHRQLIVDDVKRFFERSADTMRPAEPLQPPPGAPIGEYDLDYLLGIDVCRIR